MKSASRRCRLLELPYEIRLMIYDRVFDGGFVAFQPFDLWGVCGASSCHASGAYPLGDVRNILERKIHAEACNTSGIQFAVTYQDLQHPAHAIVDRRTGLAAEVTAVDAHAKAWPLRYRVIANSSRRLLQKRFDASLLFTCRKVTSEFAPLLYAKVTFGLPSPLCVRKLLFGHRSQRSTTLDALDYPLGHVSNAKFIQTLVLGCLPYGLPSEAHLTKWRVKYYESWSQACRLLVDSLPELRELTLYLEVPHERPYRLALDAFWVTPFLHFSGVESLTTVAVYLSSTPVYEIDKDTLGAFAEVLRRRILGQSHTRALLAIEEAYRQRRQTLSKTCLSWEVLAGWNNIELQRKPLPGG